MVTAIVLYAIEVIESHIRYLIQGSLAWFLAAKYSTKNHSVSLHVWLNVCLRPLAFLLKKIKKSSGNPYLKICDLTIPDIFFADAPMIFFIFFI